jgi:hypothetical protein
MSKKEHTGVMRFLAISLSIFVMLTVLVFTARSDDFTSRQQQRMAQKIVSDQVGVPLSDLTVAYFATAEYPLQGMTVTNFKVVDDRSGETYLVTLDARGAEQDNEALHAAEVDAYLSAYGKLDPNLVELVASGLRESDRVEVILWLQGPDDSTLARRPDPQDETVFATEEAMDSYFTSADAQYATALEAVVSPVTARLNQMGYAAAADSLAPAISANLTVADLQEVSKWSEVLWIYPSVINEPDVNGIAQDAEPENEPEMNRSKQVTGVNTVHQRGVSGFFIRVAQVEVGGRVATANPFLRAITHTTDNVCAGVSGHSTGVAGIIRSVAPGGDLGIAPGSLLWTGGSCSGNTTELHNRSTAAANWGARTVNLSWGSNTNLILGASDRFYDTMVYNQARTIVKSAGNRDAGCGLEGNVTSPGLAYNVITVGNFNANATPFVMNGCSSWRNPRSNSGDRIKPEMAAPGTNIRSTTTASPWLGNIGSGTSFAAPMVAGTTALMINRASGLTSWPESVKAILMATATTNIEGAARLSNRDGAGALQAHRADDVARRVNGNWGGQAYSCATATPLNVTTMSLVAGKRTRVVIVWDQNPNYGSYGGTTSRPSADLDLRVINPSGLVVASSLSFDNTYEIVDFTPSVSGNYQLRVNRVRCNLTPGFLGWAWYRFP